MPTALVARRALTAGGYDHFQGQLAPDGKRIYFAGNPNGTVEIFEQNLTRGFPRLLFDDAADVSQPRISPDGNELLYISYQADAGGDACLYHLRTGKRRCLTQRGVAVLHVFWFPDGNSIGALTRRGLESEHQLRRLRTRAGANQTGELLLQANMSQPAISPDGSWLAYVPLVRGDSLSARGALLRASRGVVLHHLTDAGKTLSFEPDLPGATNFPIFSSDGRHLYFAQYLNDTNFDGVTDGDDRGVLFRVRFEIASPRPIQRGTLQQLTTGRMNCQYPAPAADRLVATCVRSGLLQIYSLPLQGLVPESWDLDRIESEIQVSRDPSEQLLLLGRGLSLVPDETGRSNLYRRMIMHHVALKEYGSADHYLRLLRRTAEKPTEVDWVSVLGEMIGHRREEQGLSHGKLHREFINAQISRLGRLDPYLASPNPSARRLAHITESELHLVLGHRAEALQLFDAIDVTSETDPVVLQAWARQGEALLRDGGERGRWLDVHRTLSHHRALDERNRLYHARSFVKILSRGKRRSSLGQVFAEARSRVAPRSELALFLDLEHVFSSVTDVGELAAEAALEELWNQAASFDQKRAIAMATIEEAARRDFGQLSHAFGKKWLAYVPKDHPERKYAETLYTEVMLERAFVELAHGRLAFARDLFEQVTNATPSLEAHVGFIETSMKLGRPPHELLSHYRARFSKANPVEPFSEAYIVARGLSQWEDPAAHRAEIERARSLLRPVAEALPRSPEVHHLYAYLAHRQFHRTGEKDSAMAANTRYHLALDLAPHDGRRRAGILEELGLLQAALGNHRIALQHFSERERFPFLHHEGELSFRLAKARSLFFAASYVEAETEMDRALALTEAHVGLQRYAPLALDRAALYSYAAGHPERALRLYARLAKTMSDPSLALRMKAGLGLGASALAAGQTELGQATLESVRELLDADEPFRPQGHEGRVDSHFDRDDYRPLVAGLLAAARRQAGDLKGAEQALRERLALYQGRLKKYDRDEYLRELARISQQLAETLYREGDLDECRTQLERGLAYSDAWRKRTSTEVDEVTLALVRGLAELHLYGRVPLSAFNLDVPTRLRAAYADITRRPNPKWAHERFLFPIYLTLLDAAPPPRQN